MSVQVVVPDLSSSRLSRRTFSLLIVFHVVKKMSVQVCCSFFIASQGFSRIVEEVVFKYVSFKRNVLHRE